MSLTIRYAVVSDMAELRGIFRRASFSNENDREQLVAHPESLVLVASLVVGEMISIPRVQSSRTRSKTSASRISTNSKPSVRQTSAAAS